MRPTATRQDIPPPARASLRRRLARADVWIGLGLAVVAFCIIRFVVPTAVSEPPSVRYPPLSPSFLPIILLAIVCLSGLALAVTAVLVTPAEPSADTATTTAQGGGLLLPRLVCLAVLAGYVFAMPLIGAMAAAVIGSLILLVLGGIRKWTHLVGYGLILPVATVLFFEEVGSVPLPVFELLSS